MVKKKRKLSSKVEKMLSSKKTKMEERQQMTTNARKAKKGKNFTD